MCHEDEERIDILTRNQGVAERLFLSALRLFADSVIEYHEAEDKKGGLHFFPPIILTFWAGFETWVRYSSELMIITVTDLPNEIIAYLREEESQVDGKGVIRKRVKYHRVLDRYAVFLKYAYGYEADRGAHFWQELEKARKLRDYYTHLDICEPREISSSEVLSYLEAILLGIIVPSSHLQRTLKLRIYWLYNIWAELYEYEVDFVERPLFMEWPFKKPYSFHCNFENVDTKRFPNMEEEMERRSSSKRQSTPSD